MIQEIHVWEKNSDTVTVYRFEGISQKEAEILRKFVLTDPVTQQSILNPKRSKFPCEIAYKPGVTDPMELSLKKAASLFHIFPVAVSTSHRFKFKKDPSQIEYFVTKKPRTLLVSSKPIPTQTILIRDLTSDELTQLSQKRSLFLSPEEMQVLQKYYQGLKRDPTDVELETYAQTWSEHCYHKTFKAKILINGKEKLPLIERIKKASKKYFKQKQVVSAFSDNAGGMEFYDDYSIIGKGETHNSPVAIEPYAGSLTKNGGLYRDIAGFGKGGKNLVSFMMNNFASPYAEHVEVFPGSIHPRTLLLENSRGEREYGNPMGIPTQSISLHVHPNFGPKPTSLGVSIGIIPDKFVKKEKPKNGDLIVSIGGKTGRDGIHGATFSSGSMDQKTKITQSTAVQLGDPIVEKATFDAILALRDKGLVRTITDCGAGGYASAIGEMADGVGAKIILDQIPQKYLGLSAWELWLSESQERMVLAIDPKDWNLVEKIANQYETQATVIGKFTGTNRLEIFNNKKLVANIDCLFLHHGLPQKIMNGKYIKNNKKSSENSWKSVLSDFSVCSKELMQRMYDQTVQGITAMSSFLGIQQNIPSDASVLTPFPQKPYGIVVTSAIHSSATWAFKVAIAKFIAAGGDIRKAVGIDNFITASPDEKTLGDLDKMTDELVDMIHKTKIPMASGKDSLSSTYKAPNGKIINVPPSICVTLFGKIPDIGKTVTPDFKKIGSSICLLDSWKNFPHKKVLSAKAVAEGGIGAALAMMCFGGNCGASVKKIDFSDQPGKIIVEVASTKDLSEIPHTKLGETKKERDINGMKLETLKKIWQRPMQKLYG